MNDGRLVIPCLILLLTVLNYGVAFRIIKRCVIGRRSPGRLRSDHIDEMMFECGIYNENLRFPRNVQADLNPHSSKDLQSQSRLEDMSLEFTTKQLEIHKRRKQHMSIQLPISGEVSKPSGGHLQELYYILEEHNRQLLENQLSKTNEDGESDGHIDIGKERKLVLPTQMLRIFDSPDITKSYKLFPTTIKSQSPLVCCLVKNKMSYGFADARTSVYDNIA